MAVDGPGVGFGDAANDCLPRRFDSWKEIASYFGRDVRTVRRWEQREALPVHRHHHRSRGSVYAFQHELDVWFARRSANGAAPPDRALLSPGRTALLAAVVAMTVLTNWTVVSNNQRPLFSRPVPSADGGAIPAAGLLARLAEGDRDVLEDFLLAKHQLQRRTGYRRQARRTLEAIVQRSPDFAEAHALLAEAYIREALYDKPHRPGAWDDAEAAARRALALHAGLAGAHVAFARIFLLRDWNWAGAAEAIQRAIELGPEFPDVRSAYALYLRSAGRLHEAIRERERAVRADPLNPQWLVFLGDEYMFARRYPDAAAAYNRAIQVERDFRPAIASLADAYGRMGRYVEAAQWQLRWLALREDKSVADTFDRVRLQEGPKAALDWLDRWNLAEFQRTSDEHLWDLAYIHARLGNQEAALDLLQRACDRREPALLQARVDPDVDSLRRDPRFNELLKRIGPP